MSDNNTPTSSSAPSTAGMIRNINQTVQEREVIKTAPDIIIYLDGKTYLLNPYITNTTQNQPYTFVSFNDYVQNFSASYDVDNMVPSGNFTLQIPNFSKSLFQAPGGNNLIDTMMEVQVFAKGYYASASGNTVYHRIFKGITSHVAHTDNGMFLEISVQCLGIMHLMEYMYVDLNPALLSNSERPVQPLTSNQSNMNPYQQLADTFLRGITFEGFQLNAITQDKIRTGYWADAVEVGFCNKWQPILVNLRKEVHILGYKPGSVLPQDIDGLTSSTNDATGSNDPKMLAGRLTQHPVIAQNVSNPDFYVDVVRGYLPDMGIGSIQLTNGRITSRLERIRTIVQLIGYEGFQDLDGTIIFKPPLYNLDVTKIGLSTTPTKNNAAGVPQSTVDITDANNPFIVHLSEIETESESEDQQAIRATRVTIQPDWVANNKFIHDSGGLLRPAITHIDIPKLAKFGLREEPARTIQWLGAQDKVACYVYAVSELNRYNRGWRTYNMTIPLRPELKLGLPMYLPHKDMYGYIKTISVSYSYGGAATMSIMLDTLRKRPVFPQVKTTGQNQTVYTNPPVVYATQPNLVMKWTEAPNPSANTSSGVTQPATLQEWGAQQSVSSISTKPSVTVDGFPSADSVANLMNAPATQPQPPDKPIYQEDMEIVSARRSQYGTSWATKADTRSKNFRVQNDIATADDAKTSNGNGQYIKAGDPFFSATNWYDGPPFENPSANPFEPSISDFNVNAVSPSYRNKGVNMTYLQKVISCQPYTDEEGYEVITPFPWGRWKSLKEVLCETHEGLLVNNPTSQEAQVVTGTNVFLFAGVGSPNNSDASSTLQDQLDSLSNTANQAASATTFEIQTPKPGDQQTNILSAGQPDNFLLNTVQGNVTSNALDVFMNGVFPPQSGSSVSLASQLKSTVTTGTSGIGVSTNPIVIENNLAVVGSSATQITTQSQKFVSNLINSNTSTQ